MDGIVATLIQLFGRINEEDLLKLGRKAAVRRPISHSRTDEFVST